MVTKNLVPYKYLINSGDSFYISIAISYYELSVLSLQLEIKSVVPLTLFATKNKASSALNQFQKPQNQFRKFTIQNLFL